MISTKWFVFVFFLFILATVFSSLLEASMVGDIGLTPIGEVINGIPFINISTSSGPLHGFAMVSSFFSGLGDIFSWNYSFFNGDLYGFPLVFFRAFGFALSAILILELGLMLVNALRGILP